MNFQRNKLEFIQWYSNSPDLCHWITTSREKSDCLLLLSRLCITLPHIYVFFSTLKIQFSKKYISSSECLHETKKIEMEKQRKKHQVARFTLRIKKKVLEAKVIQRRQIRTLCKKMPTWYIQNFTIVKVSEIFAADLRNNTSYVYCIQYSNIAIYSAMMLTYSLLRNNCRVYSLDLGDYPSGNWGFRSNEEFSSRFDDIFCFCHFVMLCLYCSEKHPRMKKYMKYEFLICKSWWFIYIIFYWPIYV